MKKLVEILKTINPKYIICGVILIILLITLVVSMIISNISQKENIAKNIKKQEEKVTENINNEEVVETIDEEIENVENIEMLPEESSEVDEKELKEIKQPNKNNTNNSTTNTTKAKNNNLPTYYIKVNYTANVVTIYKKDDNGEYTIPYKAMVCSTGTATPRSGVYKMSSKYRWLSLVGGVYGQYCFRITGHILFHSVPYTKTSVDALEYWEYDKLGTSASAGCIRLTVADTKWIYDNCTKGTYVEFYSSSNPGPLGKPSARKISSNVQCRNWDPTDPASGNPWKNYKEEVKPQEQPKTENNKPQEQPKPEENKPQEQVKPDENNKQPEETKPDEQVPPEENTESKDKENDPDKETDQEDKDSDKEEEKQSGDNTNSTDTDNQDESKNQDLNSI